MKNLVRQKQKTNAKDFYHDGHEVHQGKEKNKKQKQKILTTILQKYTAGQAKTKEHDGRDFRMLIPVWYQ